MQKLSQHLKITLPEIGARKALLGFGERHEAELLANRGAAEHALEQIVEAFYEGQTAHPGIRALIGDSETLERLRGAMRGYILGLFGGDYGMDYVDSRLRIGKIHARVGVEPKYYVSSMLQLQELIYAGVAGTQDKPLLKEALHRIFMFDLQFVFDTYVMGLVQAVELARDDLIAYSESLEQIVEERTEDIRRLADTDALTGLANRRVLFPALEAALAEAGAAGAPLSLAFLDLDGFKRINDSHGHARGDEVLVQVARAIEAALRPADSAFRYGGDEFCILMRGTAQAEAEANCLRLADTISAALGGLLQLSGGIASAGPGDYPSAEEILRRADRAMYSRKRSDNISLLRP